MENFSSQPSVFFKGDSQIDSLDVHGANVIASLSNLEGNLWNGSLVTLSRDGVKTNSISISTGASTVQFFDEGNVCVM